MNRDGIDFTKTKKCCVCGTDRDLSEVVVAKFGDYTRCKTLMCPDCASMCKTKKGKNGKYSVASVDAAPGLAAKDAAMAKSEIEKAVAAALEQRPRLSRWIAEPFSVEGGRTFGKVAMANWVAKKEEAFRQKLYVMECIKERKHVPCPVCGKNVALHEVGDVEINTNLEFSCPDGHLAFDEAELAELFSAEYFDYVGRNKYNRTRSWEQQRTKEMEPEFLSVTAYGFTRVQRALYALWNGKWELVRDFMHGGECKKCEYYSDKCDGCRTKFAEEHPESWERYRLAYAFPEKMNLRGLFDAIAKSKNYRASKHCRMWCATSPDNGAARICGATGCKCGFDGESSCRLCEQQVDGMPIGNFLATAGMCQHYENGKCLICKGKDSKWEGQRNLPTCTFKATDFVYRDKGTFCENFKLRGGLDLDAAAAVSANGTSYSGYWR